MKEIDEMQSAIQAAHLQKRPIRISMEKLTAFIEECYVLARKEDVANIPSILKNSVELPPGVEMAIAGVPVIIDKVTLN